MVTRVSATPLALDWIDRLARKHGPLMFHQSGGCCDGSAPMCYPQGEFTLGSSDVQLGEIGGMPFWMSESQFEYWRHTHLIIDAVPGRGAGFSIESPEGIRFLTRSRLYAPHEEAGLALLGAPKHG
ncbi:MAG: UDP-glucose 4-epimerase [Methyloversatilis sp. 12-65-5]|nr:MAG: UDP-glucose 4-epimerase [Methyloversatilis sp. 12-65-5]